MLRRAYGWDPLTPPKELERFVSRHQMYFPKDFVMPTFLDNHDMDRFLLVAKGDKDALRRAAEAQMRLPGPPIIYYGTEVGLSQAVSTRSGGLHLSRTLMLWDDSQDNDLLDFYKELIASRKGAQNV
jgi:cyclomaltodextrinase / maltogenic alpha-amylase / neopullulanase